MLPRFVERRAGRLRRPSRAAVSEFCGGTIYVLRPGPRPGLIVPAEGLQNASEGQSGDVAGCVVVAISLVLLWLDKALGGGPLRPSPGAGREGLAKLTLDRRRE